MVTIPNGAALPFPADKANYKDCPGIKFDRELMVISLGRVRQLEREPEGRSAQKAG